MIVANSTTLFRLLRRYWYVSAGTVAILVVVEIANDHYSMDRPVFSIAVVGLLVTGLSIYLVFRVNQAYARWWEARTIWGQLVNSSRALARQVITLIASESEDEESQHEIRGFHRELIYRRSRSPTLCACRCAAGISGTSWLLSERPRARVVDAGGQQADANPEPPGRATR